MLKGFRDFILRGNVIELAVAVIIGSAFTNIVTAFTNKIINPLIASLGSTEVKGLGFQIRPGVAETFVDFGAVITAAINFLMVTAVVYFVLIVPMNKLSSLMSSKEKKEAAEKAPDPDVVLLTEIRDLLKTQR